MFAEWTDIRTARIGRHFLPVFNLYKSVFSFFHQNVSYFLLNIMLIGQEERINILKVDLSMWEGVGYWRSMIRSSSSDSEWSGLEVSVSLWGNQRHVWIPSSSFGKIAKYWRLYLWKIHEVLFHRPAAWYRWFCQVQDACYIM